MPSEIGGVRLCKASVYRKIGKEDGVGDLREGEVRTKVGGGHLSVEWEPGDGLPAGARRAMEEHEGSAAETEEWRALFAERDDDPELALQRTGPGEWSMSQNLVVGDDEIPSPYLFCLAREPTTREEWDRLRAELPDRYDTWTVTADVDAVQFEIECGIKRWLATERITRHRIERASGIRSTRHRQAEIRPKSSGWTVGFASERSTKRRPSTDWLGNWAAISGWTCRRRSTWNSRVPACACLSHGPHQATSGRVARESSDKASTGTATGRGLSAALGHCQTRDAVT